MELPRGRIAASSQHIQRIFGHRDRYIGQLLHKSSRLTNEPGNINHQEGDKRRLDRIVGIPVHIYIVLIPVLLVRGK